MNPLTLLTKKYKTSNDFMIRQSVKKELNKLIEMEIRKKPLQSNYELKVVKKENPNRFSVERVINFICEKHNIKSYKLSGKSRKRYLVIARQEAIYLLFYGNQSLTLKEIGRALGGRDHTTVIHSREQINNLISIDPSYKEEIKKMFIQLDPNFNTNKLEY